MLCQVPLNVNLTNIDQFIVQNFTNPLVSIVSKMHSCNPMSDTGWNHRKLLRLESRIMQFLHSINIIYCILYMFIIHVISSAILFLMYIHMFILYINS